MRLPSPFLILAVIMTTTSAPAADPPLETLSPGASLLWTSADPLIESARAMVTRGELAQAEKALTQAKSADRTAIDEALETIRRIRDDYSLDESAILQKLRPSIRDLSATDLTNWTHSGQIQFRQIDGQPRYFRREPSNLFRFCPDAIARRIKPPGTSPGFVLNDHLARIIEASAKDNQPHVLPVRHRIKFKVTVPTTARGYKTSATIKAPRANALSSHRYS